MIALNRLIPAPVDRVRISPNSGPRPAWVHGIRLVVLHATAYVGEPMESERWILNPASQVSAHLHILPDGSVTRLVPDLDRAWHAGRGRWGNITDVNDVSLGWEIANRNDGVDPYTPAQYSTVARLAAFYARQGIRLEAFVSHAEIALPPGRKTDPRGWDWPRFLWMTRMLLAPG